MERSKRQIALFDAGKVSIIHYIDFFVFRRFMKSVMKEGKACVPISLNFSRDIIVRQFGTATEQHQW